MLEAERHEEENQSECLNLRKKIAELFPASACLAYFKCPKLPNLQAHESVIYE